MIINLPGKSKFVCENIVVALLDPDVLDDILAEDAGVGHDGTEDEHDAGEDPDRERCDSLEENMQH